jgi:hypothetical protein
VTGGGRNAPRFFVPAWAELFIYFFMPPRDLARKIICLFFHANWQLGMEFFS